MAKHTPKTITVILLLMIAALSVLAVTLPQAEYPAVGEQTDSDLPTAEPPTDVQNPDGAGDGSDDVDTDVDTDITPEPFTPIPPEPSAVYAYTQTLWAEGGVRLNAAINTANGQYVIITHAGKEGALNVLGEKTVSVLLLETDGTVSALRHLKGGDSYLNARITSEGLTVVTAGNGKSYVHILSAELNDEHATEMPICTAAQVYSLNEGFLLFLTNADQTSAYKFNDGVITASGSILGGTIADVYDFIEYYLLAVKGIQGYSIVKLSPTLTPVTTINIPEKELLSITPIPSEGGQKYLVVERGASGVEVIKTDFNTDFARVGVGLAESAEAYMNGENILLLLHADSTRLYMVDYDLNFSSSTALKGGVERIFDCVSFDGGYKLLYTDGEKLNLLRIDRDGKTISGNFGAFDGEAALTDADGRETVFYTAGDSLKIIGVQ